jgi:hypothetical protein
MAAEHGEERARLTDFQPETLLAEFHIFRSVLFDMRRGRRVRQDDAVGRCLR